MKKVSAQYSKHEFSSFKPCQVGFELGEIFTGPLLLDVHSPKMLVKIYSL